MVIEFQTVFFGVRTVQIYCNHGGYGLLTGSVQKCIDGEWTTVDTFKQRLYPGHGFLMFSTMVADKEQPTVAADGSLIIPEWCEKYIVS